MECTYGGWCACSHYLETLQLACDSAWDVGICSKQKYNGQTDTCTYRLTYTHTYVHIHAHVHVYIRTYTWMHANIRVPTYSHTLTHSHTHTHTLTLTHTHTLTHSHPHSFKHPHTHMTYVALRHTLVCLEHPRGSLPHGRWWRSLLHFGKSSACL